jgi:hypothetical protein
VVSVVTPVTTRSSSAGSPPTLGSFDDDTSALYASLSNLRQGDLSLGESRVEEDQAASQRERAQEREAIKEEAANQANSGHGFFACVGDFFVDVVSDLAHGDFADAAHDAGRDLSDAWNSPKFWHDLETGLEGIAIVAAAVVTAGIAGVAVSATAVCVGAAAGAGAGLSEARCEHFAANAEDATANATAAQNGIDQLQELTSDVLTDVKQRDQSHERALQSLAQAVETHDQTLITAASTTVRG